MKTVGGALSAVLLGLAVWSCENSDPQAPVAPGATVRPNLAVTVSGPSGNAVPGQTVQLTATAHYSNDTRQNVTAQASWQSSNSNMANVSNMGLVTAVAPGDAVIRATYQGVMGSWRITVAMP